MPVPLHGRSRRWLRSWALDAGFSDVVVTGSMWVFATDGERAGWADLWAERSSRGSTFGDQAVAYGFATEDDLADIGESFRTWARAAGGVFFVPHGEIVCRP